MDYINKIVSKLYANIEGEGMNVLVAEVVKKPGCGFNYLIRIRPQYKKVLNIWNDCLQLCGITVVGLDNQIVERSINDGYYWTHEEIAVIIDEVI